MRRQGFWGVGVEAMVLEGRAGVERGTGGMVVLRRKRYLDPDEGLTFGVTLSASTK